MLITRVISRANTPKDKTKSNPLAREKVGILSKSVVSFFPSVLKKKEFSLPASKCGSKMNRDNKSAS